MQITKKITLFATDRAICNAPYKITCKDKVICNRLGYLLSLKITRSLENSPISDSHKIWSQQVTGVANKRLPPHFIHFFTRLHPSTTHTRPCLPLARGHSKSRQIHDGGQRKVFGVPSCLKIKTRWITIVSKHFILAYLSNMTIALQFVEFPQPNWFFFGRNPVRGHLTC